MAHCCSNTGHSLVYHIAHLKQLLIRHAQQNSESSHSRDCLLLAVSLPCFLEVLLLRQLAVRLTHSHGEVVPSFSLVKKVPMDSSSWYKVQNPNLLTRTFVCEQNFCITLNLLLSSLAAQGRVLYTSRTSCLACDNIIPIVTTSLFLVYSVPARSYCNCSLASFWPHYDGSGGLQKDRCTQENETTFDTIYE